MSCAPTSPTLLPRQIARPHRRMGLTLGEGAHWDRLHRRLLAVDIKGGRILTYDPANDRLDRWTVEAPVGFALPTTRAHLLVIGRPGRIELFDLQRSAALPLARLEGEPPGNRVNDATIGPDGALWLTTMDDAAQAATGRLWRWHPAEGTPPQALLDGWEIPNGPVFPASDTLLLAHSPHRTIERFHWRAGRLTQAGTFARFGADEGFPDGMVLDAEGHVWVALHGGGAVHRLRPDGTTALRVEVPTPQPTKPALGGPEGRTLFLTTAAEGLAGPEATGAGDLYALSVAVPAAVPIIAALAIS